MWNVRHQIDLVRGHFEPEFDAFVIVELHYLTARRGGVAYIHNYLFVNDWDGAERLLDRVKAAPDFSPLNNPDAWSEIRDVREYQERKPKRTADILRSKEGAR